MTLLPQNMQSRRHASSHAGPSMLLLPLPFHQQPVDGPSRPQTSAVRTCATANMMAQPWIVGPVELVRRMPPMKHEEGSQHGAPTCAPIWSAMYPMSSMPADAKGKC